MLYVLVCLAERISWIDFGVVVGVGGASPSVAMVMMAPVVEDSAARGSREFVYLASGRTYCFSSL